MDFFFIWSGKSLLKKNFQSLLESCLGICTLFAIKTVYLQVCEFSNTALRENVEAIASVQKKLLFFSIKLKRWMRWLLCSGVHLLLWGGSQEVEERQRSLLSSCVNSRFDPMRPSGRGSSSRSNNPRSRPPSSKETKSKTDSDLKMKLKTKTKTNTKSSKWDVGCVVLLHAVESFVSCKCCQPLPSARIQLATER